MGNGSLEKQHWKKKRGQLFRTFFNGLHKKQQGREKMKLKNKQTMALALMFVLTSIGAAIYFYPQMPETMASHWNAGGNPDGYAPKFWGLFLFPLLMGGTLLMFLLIPRVDPLKKNIQKFRGYYNQFVLAITLFFSYIQALVISWNLGYDYSMTAAIFPAVGFLLYFSSILMQHSKRNWFIGIRTPWTMSSDEVWKKTHEHGARLFKFFAIYVVLIGFLEPFFNGFLIFLFIVPLLAVVIGLVAYSYWLYSKISK
jgi:uncharacterized membrane protein